MSKQYETIFIISPLLTDEQMKETATKFRDYLTAHKAEIVSDENWGLKKLAYPVQKKSTGFYHLIEFTADPELVHKLEIEYRRDERILRFMTISLDKYAVEFNARRRKGEFNRKDRKENLPVVEAAAEELV